jgi:hypothetical protein
MTAILRILLLIPLGFLTACLAAGAVIVLALAGGPDGWQAFRAEFVPGEGERLFVLAGGIAGLIVAAFIAVPSFIIILLAELFGWRSVFFYLIAGAVIGLSGSILPFNEILPEADVDMTMLAAAGLAGGFVYWLIAGRSAGYGGRPAADAGTGDEAGLPRRR